VSGAAVVVRPARTLRAHVRRRVRVRQGGRQLDALGISARQDRLRLRALGRLISDGSVSPADAACYLGVLGIDRIMTRSKGSSMAWSTDATSR
jgi:hypothetical protein